MNGSTVPLLVYIANGLLGIVIVLLGLILRMHKESDDEHRKRLEGEIDRMRNRIHDLTGKMMEIDSNFRHRK